MKTRQKVGKDGIIHVGDNVFSFKIDGKDVVLPIVDEYRPRNDDDIVMYKEQRPDGKEDIFYSFNLIDIKQDGDDMGGLKALYQVTPEGFMKITSIDDEGNKKTYEMNAQNVKQMNKFIDGGKINYKGIPNSDTQKIIYNCGGDNVTKKQRVMPTKLLDNRIRRVR